MKSAILQAIGIAFLIAFFFFWLAGGAHGGWSQDSITEIQVDALTGIEFPVIKEGFLPGIEFLAIGFLGFALLMISGAILVWRQKRSPDFN